MYEYFSDGAATYREGVRNNAWVVDKLLTAKGFAGVENTDWTNIYSIF